MYHLCFKYQIAEIPEITHDIFIAEKFAYICTGVISPTPLVWGAGNPLIEDWFDRCDLEKIYLLMNQKEISVSVSST